MAFDDITFERVVAAVNQAVVEPSQWQAALKLLASSFDATGACLFTPMPDARAPLFVSDGSARDSLVEYATNWLGNDAWIDAANRTGVLHRAGMVEFGRNALATTMLRRTAFHGDFLRRYDIEGMMSLKICDDSDAAASETNLSLYRPTSVNDFGEDDRRRMLALWPHLRRAVFAHGLLRKARDFDRIAEDALDALPQPAWVLRDDAQIDFANRAAREALSSCPWLRTASGRLVGIGDLDAAAVHGALRAARFGGGRVRAAGFASDGRLRCAVLHVLPLADTPSFATAWPHAKTLLMLRVPATGEEQAQWLQTLGRHHRLTAAELRVLESLAAGKPPQAIAAALRVSDATVRSHLQKLYDKTGCRRQAELVLLASNR